MPLRVAMPARVMKPTIEATERLTPVSHIATTLPMRASGMLAMMMPASTADL
ncbi:hypothetical protein D3C87_1182370 [compost metagenome]